MEVSYHISAVNLASINNVGASKLFDDTGIEDSSVFVGGCLTVYNTSFSVHASYSLVCATTLNGVH